MPSVFLSHSSKDKFFVRELAERLQAHGVKVWLDEAEINVGDSLTDKIGSAITTTDFVAVVLSTNSVNSQWVQKELQIALQKEFQARNVVVLPILLEPVEIPPFLRDKLYADFSTPEKFQEQLPKLLKALGITAAVAETAKPVKRTAARETEAVSNLTEAERRLASFEDLKIVDLDESRSFKPDSAKLLYHMHLKLSGWPPSEWAEIFAAERRFPRHTMWRHAWVEGDFIVVHCVPDELERYHLGDLKDDVRHANEKYREYLTRVARTQSRDAQKQRNEKDDIRRMKDRLDFD